MGLLSKITPRFFKTTVRKVGKAIKWATKPIRKVLRKVLKPIGKAFDKLGWVGTLALMIWGGPIGAWFGNWMSTMAQGVMSMLPTGAATFLQSVGNGIMKAANFGKSVYKSITDVFKHGLNKIGQAFGMADPGKLMFSKEKWMAGEGLGFKPGTKATWGIGAPLKEKTLTGAFDEWVHRSLLGQKDYQSSPIMNTETASIAYDGSPRDFSRDLKPDTVFADQPGKKFNNLTGKWEPIAPEEISSLLAPTEEKGWWEKNVRDKRLEWQEKLANRPVGGWEKVDAQGNTIYQTYENQGLEIPSGTNPATGARYTASDYILSSTGSQIAVPRVGSWGDVGTAGKYGMEAYSAYSAIRGTPDYEQPFYNENIGISNAMLQQTEQPTYMDTLAFTGDSAQPTDTFTTLAERYLTGFGYAPPTGQTDYFNHAMQMPGYGYTFDQYLYDNAENYG